MIKKTSTTKFLMMTALLLALIAPAGVSYAQLDSVAKRDKPSSNWSGIVDDLIRRQSEDKEDNRGQDKKDKDDKPAPVATSTKPVATSTLPVISTTTATTTPVVSTKPATTSANRVAGASTGIGLRSLRSIAGTLDTFLPLESSYASTAFPAPVTWLLSTIALVSGICGVMLASGRTLPTMESVGAYIRTRRDKFNPRTTA